jgi:hypothetical protein
MRGEEPVFSQQKNQGAGRGAHAAGLSQSSGRANQGKVAVLKNEI